jgi:hypothetical protein
MDLAIVFVVVGAAVGYIGWKVWQLVRPGPRAAGCGCSSPKGSCAGCPLMKG